MATSTCPEPSTRPVPRHRPARSARLGRAAGIGAAVVSGAAGFGAAGLAFGFEPLPATLERRLPFHSPVLGALALTFVVGMPYAVLAAMAWRGDRRWPTASMLCGLGLVAWITVELAFLREPSILHPLCAATGAAFAWVGWRAILDHRE